MKKKKREQCFNCSHRLFFKPLPDESFSCCLAYGETASDINLRTGMSPKVEKYWQGETACQPFNEGESICCISKKKPFEVPPVRLEGERILLRRLISKEPLFI